MFVTKEEAHALVGLLEDHPEVVLFLHLWFGSCRNSPSQLLPAVLLWSAGTKALSVFSVLTNSTYVSISPAMGLFSVSSVLRASAESPSPVGSVGSVPITFTPEIRNLSEISFRSESSYCLVYFFGGICYICSIDKDSLTVTMNLICHRQPDIDLMTGPDLFRVVTIQ